MINSENVTQKTQQSFSFVNSNMIEYAMPVNYSFMDYLGGGNYGNVM